MAMTMDGGQQRHNDINIKIKKLGDTQMLCLQNLPNEVVVTMFLPELPKCLQHSEMSIVTMMDLHIWRRNVRIVLRDIRDMKKLGYRSTRFVVPIPVLRKTCSALNDQFQWSVPYWAEKILPDSLDTFDAPDSHYQWRYDREYI
jgi:hypothetical protein